MFGNQLEARTDMKRREEKVSEDMAQTYLHGNNKDSNYHSGGNFYKQKR